MVSGEENPISAWSMMIRALSLAGVMVELLLLSCLKKGGWPGPKAKGDRDEVPEALRRWLIILRVGGVAGPIPDDIEDRRGGEEAELLDVMELDGVCL